MLYGRNFDWEYSPALLLFVDPPDGYASVSMVDIAYLGFPGDQAADTTNLPPVKQKSLLNAPYWPFDGMNEHSLAVAMAAVTYSENPYDPQKETIDSLMIIREILDHARNTDNALEILESNNITWGGGPLLHYLIADRNGESILVEFFNGRMVIIPNENPWHLATNHLRTITNQTGHTSCWRNNTIDHRLNETRGKLTPRSAMELLANVSQGNTQWSVVYGMSTGEINVTMGKHYPNVHTLHLDLANK